MNQSAIHVRYAKAFFSIAKEKGLLRELIEDIRLVLNVCSTSEDFTLLLETPIVKTSKKAALVTSIFGSKVDELTLNFLLLIIQNKREVYIPGICRNFLDLSKKDQNIQSAVLTTATEMNANILEKVKTLLGRELDATVELSAKVNPDVLGGFVLRLDDKQYDASVATQLKKVKNALLGSEL